jgi:hypothetical protein
MNPSFLDADKISLAALQTIVGYNPANTTFSLAAVNAARSALDAAQAAEAQTAAAAAAARDDAVAKEWEFHNLVRGAKDQVIAQFGRDSNEVQALGLKKASEYKTRRGASKGSTTPA